MFQPVFLKYHYNMKFNEKELGIATNAVVLKSSLDVALYNISTDTRTIKEGDVYLPLKGESFDGEKFIEQALEKGAVGYFTTGDKVFDSAKCVFKVDNTLNAYLKLANFCRNKFDPITVAITGSSGKTTTKELVNSVLSQKFMTHKTFSNHNNEVGLCQTILGMPEDVEVLIVEMGMRGLGEIDLLSKFAEPDYAIITNAGSAHIGRLGSLDNIAIAKSEIASHLRENGVLIAQNNPRLKKFVKFNGEKIWYSADDVNVIEQKQGYSKFEFKNNIYELNVEGIYNIENSLSAIELGYKLGMNYSEICAGLLAYKPIEKRWEVETVSGFKVINDSYNANPESMKASVSTFVELYEKPIVVLGNMGELGDAEVDLHRDVGEYLAKKSKNDVKYLTVGNLAKKIGEELLAKNFFVKNFENNEDVSRYILDNVDVGCTIFLKASRSMKFEQIIENLRERK